MSRIDKLTEQLEAGKLLAGVTEYHDQCNKLMRDFIRERDGEDPRGFARAMKLKAQLRTSVIVMHYRGMNPKEVPAEHLKYALQHPLDEQSFIGKEQRQRIDGPIKGIRAFCMNCQGNDNAGVRECAAINCALWPFRMGSNPFYGRLAASEEGMTDAEVQAELDADEEEEANADTETP